MKEQETYDVTIGGLYFANVDGQVSTKPYEVSLVMDEQHVKAGVLSVFKNIVAPEVMPASYPDFTGLYTFNVLKAVPKSGKRVKDISLMVRSQLVEYINENELPVEEKLYDDEGALRQAIVECKEDPEVFGKSQAALRERKSGTMALKDSFRNLNKASAAASGGKGAAKKDDLQI